MSQNLMDTPDTSPEAGLNLHNFSSATSFDSLSSPMVSTPNSIMLVRDSSEEHTNSAKVDSLADAHHSLDVETKKLRMELVKLKLIAGSKAFKIIRLEQEVLKIQKQLDNSLINNTLLEDRVQELEQELAIIKGERIMERNLMLVRQLATSYQYRAAKYVDVGSVDRRYCTTHPQIMDSARKAGVTKETKAVYIEQQFLRQRASLSTTTFIANIIKQVRELGTSTSHPCLMINEDLSETPPTSIDMIRIIEDLFVAGLISAHVRDDSLIILEVINVISPLVGVPDILQSHD